MSVGSRTAQDAPFQACAGTMAGPESHRRGAKRHPDASIQGEPRLLTSEQAQIALLRARAGEQAVRMQRVTAALARALTAAQVCDVLARDGAAALGAPTATMYLFTPDTESVELTQSIGENCERMNRVTPGDVLPLRDVMRTGEPQLITSRRAMLETYPAAEELVDATHMSAAAVIPIATPGRVHAVWWLSWHEDREFEEGELMILLGLAAQGGHALARSRLFEREKVISQALQRTLLPAELPTLEAASIASRYLPGNRDVEVGGDWYDVLQTSDQRVILAVGDVAGHSIDSAAVMGQIRNAVRSYAWEGHTPDAVLDRTNKLLCGLEPGVLVTCCLVELHLDEGIASVALAGHPPPLVRKPDGATSFLEARADPPLGTDDQGKYRATTLFVEPSDTIVMYTDGLIESRSDSIVAGLDELARAAQASSTNCPEDLADELIEAMDVKHREDDVAMLLVAYTPQQKRNRVALRTVSRRLTPEPASAGIARRFASDVATEWGAGDSIDQLNICVSEIVTNALIHTAADIDLTIHLSPSNIRVEVKDASDRAPALKDNSDDPAETTGRGLFIVDTIASDWGVEFVDSGKVVWFELEL